MSSITYHGGCSKRSESKAKRAAIIRAPAIGKQNPNDPRAMNLALRDELRRWIGKTLYDTIQAAGNGD
jgi:hypothetical protein